MFRISLQKSAVPQDAVSLPAPLGTGTLILGAIFLGSGLGRGLPNAAETFSQGIDTTLLFMIFLIFFDLRLKAFVRAFTNIRFLALAWSANFLIIPLIGLGVASLFLTYEPVLFIGLMIYFLAPCTDWFLGFTRLAKGDTELAAALIPINMLSQLLLFPFWIWMLTKNTDLAGSVSILSTLFQWFVVPLVAAQALRLVVTWSLPPKWAEQIHNTSNLALPYVLAAVIAQLFASHITEMVAYPVMLTAIIGAVFLFFALTLLVGSGLSRLLRLEYPQQALLSMTMAARNAPLMLALTALAMPDQPLNLAVIISGMLVEIPLLTALSKFLPGRKKRQR